ncbi:hypothetical protein BCR39DRAFT_545879 [Naematelia encephala]|uniref:Actin cytoskeleton-regulatory complex protein SLA1 n=1 Tax=Naematelia encephala TaxID=71784 RepID=A0A1Y2AQC4_9TREE|nr:hypothetical protein BCR39DRAFT_545879 [Naematelia encephala]
MAYVAVVKALYDYTAQDPETELSFKEDEIIYVIEKEDDDWWKGKVKEEAGSNEAPVGLIPATYVEELPALNTTRALYAYESTSPEELTLTEDATCHVYSIEDDWLLVRLEGGDDHLGFVPRTYCEPLDDAEAVAVPDAADAEADVEAVRRQEEEAQKQRDLAEKQRQLKLKDKVETWGVAEMDGKKKKKGTLGVGNGAVFFASDTDKMTPVKQYPITELGLVSQSSSKHLELSFTSLSSPLIFHCGSSDVASAILAKLESSKAAAGEALELGAADAVGGSSGEEEPEAPAEPKTVRWAEPSRAAPAASAATTATVLYDFDAAGDDELSVKETEVVTVVDKENDEWWTVRNSSGHEGVVPAQYVQLNDGSAPAQEHVDHADEEARRAAEEAAASAALEQDRQRERERKAEERRAIERAARVKREQEEQDRLYAEQVEQKEAAKAQRRALRREQEARDHREIVSEQRREQARKLEPPKISKRPSAQDVSAAAANLPRRGRGAPERPPDSNRPKPNPGRIRTWSDKSGQFKVDAEYLGLNGNKIRLHKTNGVIIEVPIEKMSTEDTQMIKRHEARKRAAAAEAARELDDDAPLAQQQRKPTARSVETRARTRPESPIPAAALEMPKPRKPRYDWFAFFLDAGCDMDDCTRYATNFERDRIDEDLLPDMESSTFRSLGLKEGDVIRVRRSIMAKFAKTPEQQAQLAADEEYARQLQEHENNGGKGPVPQPPPSLFTGPDGKLANNTRRGRPEKKSTGASSVDAASIAAASDQLSKTTIKSPTPPPVTISPPPEEKPATPLVGFDDDAWTIKPSTSKPASPAPPPAPPAPAPPATSPLANTTESLLAQIQSLRPASTGLSANNTGGSFDRISQMVGQPRAPSAPLLPSQTGASGFSNYGLGVQNTGQPMGQMLSQQTGYAPQQQNGPRGPPAPVPSNEALLNPLQPARTGFVPTHPNPQAQQQQGMMPQQTGFMPQQQPMVMQPTGYAQGFQATYGGQPQQIQPNFTGFPGNYPQQSQQSSFNTIASMQQQQPQQAGDKFAPSNIFAAMKKTDFAKPEEQRPQESVKYDSLRPLTTGYNGAPGQMMMSQPTGMIPQQTGMMGNGMGMGMMQGQQTGMPMGMGGMVPQMTGYNPQMGYMGQGQQYGQYR